LVFRAGLGYDSPIALMNGMRFAIGVLAGGTVSSLSDWLFMGDLLYRKFNQYPEIWRHVGGKGESAAIAWSTPLPFLTCGVFVWLCAWLNLRSAGQVFELAVAIWLVAALPMLIVTGLFIKMQSAIVASYCAGWLVKLLVAATTVVWILR
jgi:hypothetical protein